MSNEKLLDIAKDGTLLAIESIMQRWHLGRSNDTEAMESISELLKSVGLLSFFDKEKEGESKKNEVRAYVIMHKGQIKKELEEILNRPKNWYYSERRGAQLDISNTKEDILDWVESKLNLYSWIGGEPSITAKCNCGQNALPYKAQIEIDKCSRCGNSYQPT